MWPIAPIEENNTRTAQYCHRTLDWTKVNAGEADLKAGDGSQSLQNELELGN
jgi:hypothetical protein